jgi:hypothetical protein
MVVAQRGVRWLPMVGGEALGLIRCLPDVPDRMRSPRVSSPGARSARLASTPRRASTPRGKTAGAEAGTAEHLRVGAGPIINWAGRRGWDSNRRPSEEQRCHCAAAPHHDEQRSEAAGLGTHGGLMTRARLASGRVAPTVPCSALRASARPASPKRRL